MIINPEALTAWRQERGYSMSQLARELDISLSYLSQIESGKKIPRAPIVRSMADILRVNVHALIKNPNAPKRPAKAARR